MPYDPTNRVDSGDRPRHVSASPAWSIQRVWAQIIGRIATISDDETKVSTRGFSVSDPETVARLEHIGRSFAWGYNRAIRSSDLRELCRELEGCPSGDAGFAYEGAGMGVALGDWFTPSRRMFDAFVLGPAHHHEYMAWVGFGWALARLPVSPVRALSRYQTINRWLALDGYGFHEGYFNWRRAVLTGRRTRGFVDDAGAVFDQGLGRSLWFVCGTEPAQVEATIETFDRNRHSDLWSGVGLAAAYAGGTSCEGLRELRDKAGPHGAALAQGVVFAAEARRRANNPAPHTDLACAELLGTSHSAAADVATDSLEAGDGSLWAYQQWRRSIQERCQAMVLANASLHLKAAPCLS